MRAENIKNAIYVKELKGRRYVYVDRMAKDLLRRPRKVMKISHKTSKKGRQKSCLGRVRLRVEQI